MPKQLVLATNNAGKITELQHLLPSYQLLTLRDIGFHEDIPEPYLTFKENAHTKALTVHRSCGLPCLADDSGLCVDMLHGAPGVHSSYYGGTHGNAENNMQKLLEEMKVISNRTAHFISVLCYVDASQTQYFEGRVQGKIAETPSGDAGFGYDPIFIPEGYDHSFASMEASLKNSLSHRAKAVAQFVKFMQQEV